MACLPWIYYLVWQKGLANAVKLGPWNGEIILVYAGGPTVIIRVLIRQDKKVKSQRKSERSCTIDFEDEENDHELECSGGFWKLEKAKECTAC